MQMKFTDILTLVKDYEQALWAPKYMSVRLGCDCGCGGDSYTPEQYDKENADADAAMLKVKEFCTTYGILFDGEEE